MKCPHRAPNRTPNLASNSRNFEGQDLEFRIQVGVGVKVFRSGLALADPKCRRFRVRDPCSLYLGPTVSR